MEQIRQQQAEQQLQIGQLNIEKARRDAAAQAPESDDALLQAVMEETAGDPDKIYDALMKRGKWRQAQEYRKGYDEHLKATKETVVPPKKLTAVHTMKDGVEGTQFVEEQPDAFYPAVPKPETAAESALPVSAKEYEYAKTQGYKGTFQQYQNEDANRKRPTAGGITVPVVIQTSEGPQLLNRSTGTTSPIKTAGGDVVQPAPTALMRNKADAKKLVTKSIDSMETLSKRIITRVGPAQRADAIKRGAEAVFGTDPEFRTYQDARLSLAGNLAVAQQGARPSDADILRIWLPLVPDAYRDTSESAGMKWNLIKTMSNTAQEDESGTTPASSGGGLSYQEYVKSRQGKK